MARSGLLPILWSDEELNTLSRIMEDDMQAAITAWMEDASDPWKELVLARPKEDSELEEIAIGGLLLSLSGAFIWNAASGVYERASTGRIIPFATVRDVTEKTAQGQLEEMLMLSKRLQSGEIPLAEWQNEMIEKIKILHINSMVSARGGWAQMSQSDWGYVGSELKRQYEYLRNFAQQIADGSQRLDGTFLFRTQMYEDAARSTFEQMRRREEQKKGMEEEMRELGIADHCDDCLEYAGRGWQPIGTLPRIGDSVCRTNCHCRFRFRRKDANGEYIYSEG